MDPRLEAELHAQLLILWPPVFAFFQRRLGPEADIESLTQEVMCRAWKDRERFECRGIPADSIRVWIFGIARNVVREERRQRRPQHLHDSDDDSELRDPERGPADWLAAKEAVASSDYLDRRRAELYLADNDARKRMEESWRKYVLPDRPDADRVVASCRELLVEYVHQGLQNHRPPFPELHDFTSMHAVVLRARFAQARELLVATGASWIQASSDRNPETALGASLICVGGHAPQEAMKMLGKKRSTVDAYVHRCKGYLPLMDLIDLAAQAWAA